MEMMWARNHGEVPCEERDLREQLRKGEDEGERRHGGFLFSSLLRPCVQRKRVGQVGPTQVWNFEYLKRVIFLLIYIYINHEE